MALVPSPICQSFTQQLRFFINFIKFSSFSCTCAPDLVITTHPGLPSPPTIDWPPIPPTCWPSATLCPTPHRFLSISHPIHLSIHLFVCQPTHLLTTICLAANPSTPVPHSACLGLEPTPIHPPTLSGFHPHLSICHPPNPPGLHALFCQSIHLSTVDGEARSTIQH